MKLLRSIGFFLLIFVLVSVMIKAEDTFIYIVEKGDSLIQIAKNFNKDLKEIIKLNKINNPDLIRIGQKIYLPTKKDNYIVKKGDSLWKIAKKFKIKLKALININQLDNPNLIIIGQRLNIPIFTERDRYILASRSHQVNFIWPVQGRISSPFGWRTHPIRKRREFHTGLDIAIPISSPVYAAAEGIVSFSGWSKGYGNLIIIKHQDNQETYYGHNLELLVKKGEIIKQGRVIALSGNTGVSTGPHLHFEIRIKGKPKDPMKYLNHEYLSNGFKV